MQNMRDLIETVLSEGVGEINGVRVFEGPTFRQLVNLVRRSEMKGHVLGPVDQLVVWNAHDLTHYDVVMDSGEFEFSPDEDFDELPGFSYSFTAEGVDADSEWGGGLYVEGNGLRIYYNGEASLEHRAILPLLERMK